MQLLQLTQCDGTEKGALHPVWINPAYIVSIDRQPNGTTQVRTVIGPGFVTETPSEIQAALSEIHLDVEVTATPQGVMHGGDQQAGA